jgi:uncharacterized beta-barrel protein YwiB (DUF1934 family)
MKAKKDKENKKVVVRIRSEQTQYDEKPSVIDNISDGELIKTEKGWDVIFREAIEGSISDATTTIRIEDNNNVYMDRIGTHEMKMDFIEGKRHISRVNTPYGTLDVGFMTSRVATKMDENGGRVYLAYTINYNDEFPIKTTLNISINPR